jgi:hypothetical protein
MLERKNSGVGRKTYSIAAPVALLATIPDLQSIIVVATFFFIVVLATLNVVSFEHSRRLGHVAALAGHQVECLTKKREVDSVNVKCDKGNGSVVYKNLPYTGYHNVYEAFGYVDDKDRVVDSVNAETGLATVVEYNRSFAAKLIQSSEDMKWYYAVIKNLLMNFKKSISFVTWNNESISYGKHTIAKIAIHDEELRLYLPLNPDEYKVKYKVERVNSDTYWEVPCMLSVSNADDVEKAKDLIFILAKKMHLGRGEERYVDYHVDYRTTEDLLEQGLIRSSKEEIDYNNLLREENLAHNTGNN